MSRVWLAALGAAAIIACGDDDGNGPDEFFPDVAGVYAMYDGPKSPLTQTFGLGMFASFLDAEFERVEAFFAERGAPTAHETCSFASPATRALLEARGYTPIEHSVVLTRDTAVDPPGPGPITVRHIEAAETDQRIVECGCHGQRG